MSTFPELPPALATWRWAATPIGDVELHHPAGDYTTKSYAQGKRAIADALRWLERQQPPPAAMPAVPADLAGWHWELRAGYGLRLIRPEEGWITQWHPADREGGPIVEARQLQESAAPATALIVADAPLEGFIVLTREEARQAADAIVTAVEDLRIKIDAFDQGRGWMALGYESFRAWAMAEIPDASLRHVYRLRDAAEVDRSLGVTIGHTPESHARELKPVPPAERPAVLGRADELAAAAGRERTAADVRQVAQRGTIGHTAPAGTPGPVPILYVTDAELFKQARATYSADRLMQGSMRRPFSYAGRLWINVGASSRGDFLAQAQCVAVVPVGETYAPGEHLSMYREGAYTGRRATAHGQQYELTGHYLVITEPAPASAPSPFDFVTWSRRASALGVSLLAYADDWLLVEPNGSRQRFPNGQEAALAQRLAELEQQLAPARYRLLVDTLAALPARPRRASRGDASAVLAELEQLRQWAAQVEEQIVAVIGLGRADAAPASEAEEPEARSSPAEQLTAIAALADALEQSWAAGALDAMEDTATVAELIDELEALAPDLSDADNDHYDRLRRRLGDLQARYDDEGVPQ